jgi:hypothetical protein
MPGAEIKLKSRMQEFYKFDKTITGNKRNFHMENRKGYAILEKIARMPFSLIISAAPDNTLPLIFEQHNKKHRFVFFDGTRQELEAPTKDDPVIFNFLGNPAHNGNYVFTYKQFHKYINEKQDVKVPGEIESKVQEAQHYLFLGFDFE